MKRADSRRGWSLKGKTLSAQESYRIHPLPPIFRYFSTHLMYVNFVIIALAHPITEPRRREPQKKTVKNIDNGQVTSSTKSSEFPIDLPTNTWTKLTPALSIPIRSTVSPVIVYESIVLQIGSISCLFVLNF